MSRALAILLASLVAASVARAEPPRIDLVPRAAAPAPASAATGDQDLPRWFRARGGLPWAEHGALVASGAANLTLFLLRPTIDGASGRLVIGAPAPDGLDRSIADAFYHPNAGPLHLGIPDYLGNSIEPVAFVTWYLVDAIVYWSTHRSIGRRLLHAGEDPRDPARPARLFYGALELVSFAGLVQQVANSVVDRDRPYVVLGRPEYARHLQDDTMSFYSGHAAMAFAIAGYASMDLGDWLSDGPLAERSLAVRILVGRLLPALALYGLASWIAVSRLYDQSHWFSDVVTGAAVGTVAGNAIYLWHRHAPSRSRVGTLVPTGTGAAWLLAF